MKENDIPSSFLIPFGASAASPYIRPIPKNSQIGIVDGAASLETGFVPLNFIERALGGVPPFGQDFNGLLKQITSWNQWQNVGSPPPPFDATLSASIGGYPRGAILRNAAGFTLYWVCAVDDNPTNPDAGGANWAAFRWANPPLVVTSSATLTMDLIFGQYALKRASAPAAMIANLPPATSQYNGMNWKVVDILGNLQAYPVTVTPPGGHTISGRATYTMNEDWQSAVFTYYGGTDWSVET